MTDDKLIEIEALLDRAESAHGDYEKAELGGVYDQDWPAWYAHWAVEHGLGEILGHAVVAEEVAEFFIGGWAEYRAIEPRPAESWAAWTARRIASEL